MTVIKRAQLRGESVTWDQHRQDVEQTQLQQKEATTGLSLETHSLSKWEAEW